MQLAASQFASLLGVPLPPPSPVLSLSALTDGRRHLAMPVSLEALGRCQTSMISASTCPRRTLARFLYQQRVFYLPEFH